ncbi:MAG: selenide, water dikinase SelD [Pseudomonadota bacterium]
MQRAVPITRDVVLLGGGHSHAIVLRKWGMRPLPGARLTLIDPEPMAPYTGMLPGFVAGHYRREEVEIDLVRLARFAGARLVLGRAIGLDRRARHVLVEGRAPVAYDILSINIGIAAPRPPIPGADEYLHHAKPFVPFVAPWLRFCADVEAGRRPPHAAVLGGGVAGVELALAIAERLRDHRGARITLLEREPEILGEITGAARQHLLAALQRASVRIETAILTQALTADTLTLIDGREIPAAFAVATTGASAASWLDETGLATTDGFLEVDATLRSTSDPTIFAAGDAAHMRDHPRPKAGVFAVRQGPVLFRNLRRASQGLPPRPFRPQRAYLKLVSTGGRQAVADKWGLTAAGPWVWRWKDGIDRRFMDRFLRLPAMAPEPWPEEMASGVRSAAGTEPLCAGCGAKLGAPTLERALASLPPPRRADVLTAAGDDAALLIHAGQARQVISHDHLRAFLDDPWLMARIAAIHALGDIWAMGAAPQALVAAVTLPQMASRPAEEALREVLAAAGEVAREAGADLVGGHSTFGAELTIGFTVTGLTTRPVAQSGARAGDLLLLTKAIGVGTILAAEMRGRASGRVVAGALASMQQGSGPAAAVLGPVATAMTDVTGFGLAGHLLNLLGEGLGAELDLGAIPMLAGAEELAAAGIRSSIWAENAGAGAAFAQLPEDDPRATLLFDPQTAGGLLAAIPADAAEATLRALSETPAPAAVIGRVADPDGPVRIRHDG